MKIKHQNLYFILALFLFSQCTTAPTEKLNTARVSGKITNPKGMLVSFFIGEETITDSLNQENEFSTLLNISEGTEVTFKHGDEVARLFLKPGYDLNLSLDTEAFDKTLKFSGKGKEVNNFKASLVLMKDTAVSTFQLAKLPEDSFLIAMNDHYAKKSKLIEESDITDQEFIANYNENNKWKYVFDLSQYEDNHAYLIGKQFEVSEDYYDFQDSLDFTKASNLKYQYFFPVIESMISQKVQKELEGKEFQGFDDYMSFYIQQFDSYKNDTIQEQLYFEVLDSYFNSFSDGMIDTVMRDWKKINPPAEHIEVIEEKLAKWAELQAGKPAPDFKYVSIEGDSLTMKDFLGKVVYIDVWATWCGPCIAEHPAMEKLQASFKDKAVAFVAVSIDDSTEPWRKMVEKKNLGGIHLYAQGAWSSDIIDNYLINGIPRFILIDKEGNIVNADAARPSGNIAEEIEKLL